MNRMLNKLKCIFISVAVIMQAAIFYGENEPGKNKIQPYDLFLYGVIIGQKNILIDKSIDEKINKNFVSVGFFGGAAIPEKNGFTYKSGIAMWATPTWADEDKKFLPENYGINISSRFGYKHRFETKSSPVNTTFDLSFLGGIKFTTDQIGFGSLPDIELLDISLWVQHGKFFFTGESVLIYNPFFQKKDGTDIWKIYCQSYIKSGYEVFNFEKFFRNIYGRIEFNIEMSNIKYTLDKEKRNDKESISPLFESGYYLGLGCFEFGGGFGIDPKNFFKNEIYINKIFCGIRFDIGDIKISTRK